MPFLMLRLFIQERERGDVKKNERSGEKKGTNDIGQPMNPWQKSSDHSNEGEEEAKDGDCKIGYTRFHTMTAGKGGGDENATGKHGVRGGIGCFQSTADKDGTVIDNDELEQYVEQRNKHIENAKQQKLAIDCPKALVGGELKKPDQRKDACNAKRNHAEKLCKVIPKRVFSNCFEEGLIDAREADLRGNLFVIGDGGFAAEGNKNSENDKQGK